jgi:hypothetical protein
MNVRNEPIIDFGKDRPERYRPGGATFRADHTVSVDFEELFNRGAILRLADLLYRCSKSTHFATAHDENIFPFIGSVLIPI